MTKFKYVNLPEDRLSREPIDLIVSDISRSLRLQANTYIAEMLAKLSPLDITIDDVVLESYPVEIESSIDMDLSKWDLESNKIRVTQKFRLRLKTEEEKAEEAARKTPVIDEDEIYRP